MQEVHLQRLSVNDPEGANVNEALAIDRLPCVVGRLSECDLRLNLPFISRRHCSLFVRDGQVWVQDLGSRNGTRLNGEPVQVARPLQDGDRLDLSHLAFQVRLRLPPGMPTAEPDAAVEAAGATGPPRHVLVVRHLVKPAGPDALQEVLGHPR